MRRNLLSLMLAAVLGVAIMLVPLLLIHTDMRVMGGFRESNLCKQGRERKNYSHA